MNRYLTTAMAGLALASPVAAQSWADFDDRSYAPIVHDDVSPGMSVEWRLRFGAGTLREDAQTFRLGLAPVRDGQFGKQAPLMRFQATRNGLDFSGPDTMYADGEGRWYWPESTGGKVLVIGVAALAAWGIYEAVEDDDNPNGDGRDNGF